MAQIFVALLLFVFFLPPTSCRQAAAPDFVTQRSDVGDVRKVVSATGQIEARTKVNVGSQVAGTLRRVYVTWNDPVVAGQLLAELDPRLYAAQLARADAAVAVAQANLQRARVDGRDKARTAARFAALAGQNLVAQAEVDAAQLGIEQANATQAGAAASLTQARADRDQAAANLALTKIVSPIDGVIMDRQVDEGQTVAAQFQVATLFVVAADMHQVQLVVSVDEADIAQLKEGLAAEFRVSAYPNRTFTGKVVSVRPAPQVASGNTAAVVTYAAVVAAENPGGALRQGMTVELTAVVAAARDVVRVPLVALRYEAQAEQEAQAVPKGEGEKVARLSSNRGAKGDAVAVPGAAEKGLKGAAVATATPDTQPPSCPPELGEASRNGSLYVELDGKAVRRQVCLGIDDDLHVAVLRGLQAGERVVVGDAQDAAGKRRRRGLL